MPVPAETPPPSHRCPAPEGTTAPLSVVGPPVERDPRPRTADIEGADVEGAAPARRRVLRRWTRVALLATAVLAALGLLVGEQLPYAQGFAPPMVGLIASALGLSASTARPGPWSRTLGWIGVALLLWAGAGLLFDALRAAAVLGLPGLPAEVDLLGLVRRGTATLGAVLLALLLMPRRASRAASPLWGVAGALAALPYPALKVYWWAGGAGAREFAGTTDAFPVMEVVIFGLAASWSVALVSLPGPAVVRRVLGLGGWVATILLMNMGALAGFGTLADVTGVVDGPFEPSAQGLLVAGVYGSWFALGLCLGRASLGSGRTRPDRAVL